MNRPNLSPYVTLKVFARNRNARPACIAERVFYIRVSPAAIDEWRGKRRNSAYVSSICKLHAYIKRNALLSSYFHEWFALLSQPRETRPHVHSLGRHGFMAERAHCMPMDQKYRKTKLIRLTFFDLRIILSKHQLFLI